MNWDIEFSEEFLKDVNKHQKSGTKTLLKKSIHFLLK